jgi:hypothetical protein
MTGTSLQTIPEASPSSSLRKLNSPDWLYHVHVCFITAMMASWNDDPKKHSSFLLQLQRFICKAPSMQNILAFSLGQF